MQRYYWYGNVAKSRAILEIVSQSDRKLLVFDYGCGGGGDWPAILRDFPNISLVGYEPDAALFRRAKDALAGTGATLYTGAAIETLAIQANYVVSFSVFEHVFDRRAYLQHARRCLAPKGTFYLNYDDGHFRNLLDLNDPSQWKRVLRVWIHNRLAKVLPHRLLDKYQSRVRRQDADRMVAEAGFMIMDERYENLESMKALIKTVRPEKYDSFTSLWLDLERQLNEHFLCNGPEKHGDTANLWHYMGTRTLVLQHRVP